ncbi:MAG: hypothetical protein ACYCQI_02385 [Gammaproteobacteria bacterium]
MEIEELNIKPLNTYNLPLCENSETIFKFTKESIRNFRNIYKTTQDNKIDPANHTDQDLLRAMLIFSCSGLDALIKQLVKDTLKEIILKDQKSIGAKQQFQTFVEKKLKKGSFVIEGSEQTLVDQRFLAKILISDQPQLELINFLIKDLIDGSLQSQDELLRAAAFFAITKEQILEDSKTTQEAFKVRNIIIHQMDVDFAALDKSRYVRTDANMIMLTENILTISVNFINAIAEKLR